MADAVEIVDKSDAIVNEIAKLTERIYVKENKAMNDLCHKQTAVYNQALWYLRQEFFNLGDDWKIVTNKNGEEKQVSAGFLTFYDLNDKSMLKWKQCYRDAIPLCAANTIQRVCDSWKSYWKALKAYSKNQIDFTGKPKMPGYISKNDKSPVYFTYVQFSIKDKLIHFPRNTNFGDIKIPRLNDQNYKQLPIVKQIRIIPCKMGGYWVECVHDVSIEPADVNEENVMGIDLGMNNIATIVDNLGNQPIMFSGNEAKTINHWYNIEIAKLKKNFARSNPRLAELQRKRETGLSPDEWHELKSLLQNTKQMNVITEKRNRRINKIFHDISKRIIDIAVERKIGTIVVGHNEGQKQNLDKGRRFNQNFGQLPIFKLIQKLRYKAELHGINIVEITEEFTSKASCIDGDDLPDRRTVKKKENGHSDIEFSGKRTKRGLYISKNGTQIHADVNGAYNILRKGCPEALGLNGMGARLYPKQETI